MSRASRSASVTPEEQEQRQGVVRSVKPSGSSLSWSLVVVITSIVMVLVPVLGNYLQEVFLYVPCLVREGTLNDESLTARLTSFGVTNCEFNGDVALARKALVSVLASEYVQHGNVTVSKSDAEDLTENKLFETRTTRTPRTHFWMVFEEAVKASKRSSRIKQSDEGERLSLSPAPSLFSVTALDFEWSTIYGLALYFTVTTAAQLIVLSVVPIMILVALIFWKRRCARNQREINQIIAACYSELRTSTEFGVTLLQLRRQVEANLRGVMSQATIRSHWRFPGDGDGPIEGKLKHDVNGVIFLKRNGVVTAKLRSR
eukprot:TRINITY_DN21551_c0_g1_i1.p1 TRINITY_DN21551_c0_g1~~TRINITY_DN21551_c0_g1_i1.p1  ORF type:complete len:336 (+),score=39.65 TRINITY_DN21551_c0_g1_i1:63-1010(+)